MILMLRTGLFVAAPWSMVYPVPGFSGQPSDAMAAHGDVGGRANFACESCREL